MSRAIFYTDPGPVVNLTQKTFSPHDLMTTFTWDAPNRSIDRFHVRWWIDGQDPQTLPATIPSFTLHNLKSGCQYSVQVACILSEDEHQGVWSVIKTFETAATPPNLLSVSPGSQSPSTSFLVKYHDKDSIGKTYKVIVRSLHEEEDTKVKETNDLFALVDGLSPGQTYHVSVTCEKNGIESVPCKYDGIKQTVPEKVGELRGQRTSPTSQTISWNNVFGADAYLVKWRKMDGNFQSTSTKETQITLQQLGGGQNYEVCVAAENSSGTGEFSDPRQFGTDLSPPSSLTAVIKYAGDNARAEIDFMGDGGQETKQYLVKLTQYGTNGDEDEEMPAEVKAVSTTPAVFANLDHGICFVPSIIAIGENGAQSREISGTPIWTRPGLVEGLINKTVSGNTEEIKWKETIGASSYDVMIRAEGRDPVFQTGITEKMTILNNLSLNTNYSVSVAAANEGGVGRFSAPIKFQTALSPPCMIVVKNHPEYPENGIIATWQQSDDAAQYIADLIDTTTNKAVVVSRVQKECRMEFWKKVKPGHLYKVALQSIGSSAKQHSEIVHSESIWTYCSRVEELDVKLASATTVEITWKNVDGAEKYRIVCKARNGKVIQKEPEESQFMITNLELGETYTITITPWNPAGYGRESIPKIFRTRLAPPSEVKVSDITQHSTKIQFTPPRNEPPTYSVSVMPLSVGESPKSAIVKHNHCILDNLEPGTQHEVRVMSSDPESPHLDSEKTYPIFFLTAPPTVGGIKVIKDSSTSRTITWNAVIGASNYIIKQKKEGCPPVMHEPTEMCEYHLSCLDLHSKYTISIIAQNSGGKSKESEKIPFETELHSPKRLDVTNDKVRPTTDLNIQVQESETPSSLYRLRIKHLNGEPDKFLVITRQEAMTVKKVCDLTPGHSYQIAISSLHEKDEKLNSKELLSDVIQTKTPPLTVKTQKISNVEYKVTWEQILGATAYMVRYRIQFGEWKTKHTKPEENEIVIKDLKNGQNYEVKVIAINEAGPGKESQVMEFTTGPSTPTELKAEAISTQLVKFSCKASQGTLEYIFNVNGKEHRSNQPNFTLKHASGITEFDFNVSASNNGGISNLSETLHYSQPLLKLRRKNLKKANDYNSNFIIPVVSEFSSGNLIDDFGKKEFQIGVGNTVAIFGTDFSGKTSCVLQHLRNLPENLLPVFLDWDHYKGSKKTCDIKSVLSQQMKHFERFEINFVFDWMKSHSDQVVFVVDNLSLPHSVVGKSKLYDDAATIEEIFYGLVSTRRDIFTQSQVLCSTSQRDLAQIIKPNRTLMIEGFDNLQIKEMIRMELGEESDISKHLEWFCVNPSFCIRILQLMKNDEPSVDMQSYSSVLMKLISDSVSRHHDEKKKEKLTALWKQIRDVPQKLKTDPKVDPSKVPKRAKSTKSNAGFTTHKTQSVASDIRTFTDLQESPSAKHCCKVLHDYITKALFFGLSCSLQEFKDRFHKKTIQLGANAKIWILAAGLLRQNTVHVAAQLFKDINRELDMKVMSKKLEFTKDFVKKNVQQIHEQMKADSQITLDWLDIVNEIDAHDLIPKSDWKVSVKNSDTTAQVQQMEHFLTQVRGIFFSVLRVKLEKDLHPERRIPIEGAMRNNADGEILQNDSTSTGQVSHKLMNLSFRTKGKSTNTKPDLHSALNSVNGNKNDEVFEDESIPSDKQSFYSEDNPAVENELDASPTARTGGHRGELTRSDEQSFHSQEEQPLEEDIKNPASAKSD